MIPLTPYSQKQFVYPQMSLKSGLWGVGNKLDRCQPRKWSNEKGVLRRAGQWEDSLDPELTRSWEARPGLLTNERRELTALGQWEGREELLSAHLCVKHKSLNADKLQSSGMKLAKCTTTKKLIKKRLGVGILILLNIDWLYTELI